MLWSVYNAYATTMKGMRDESNAQCEHAYLWEVRQLLGGSYCCWEDDLLQAKAGVCLSATYTCHTHDPILGSPLSSCVTLRTGYGMVLPSKTLEAEHPPSSWNQG